MPFVTEEIYGNLPQVAAGERPASLFDSRYGQVPAEWGDAQAEKGMEAFMAVVAGLRSTREELGLPRDLVGKVRLVEQEPGAAGAIAGLRGAFRQLSGCELSDAGPSEAAPAGRFASIAGQGVKALLDLEGLVDIERERERLVNKAKKADVEAAKARGKLTNQGFVAKAPEAVVAEERARLAAAEDVLREVRQQYEERIGGEFVLGGSQEGKRT
jgi:valyl-tRNA synthetase